MSEGGGSIIMQYSGLSLGEIEVLFNILQDTFPVSDQIEEMFDERNVSEVKLSFPLSYNEEFFKMFGIDRWEGLKEVLKNIKWRRGKKPVKLVLSFGSNPTVLFVICTDNNKMFGKALDTLEYLVDLILLQIDAKKLPSNTKEIQYECDKNDYRWHPNKAIGDKEHIFVRDEWTEI